MFSVGRERPLFPGKPRSLGMVAALGPSDGQAPIDGEGDAGDEGRGGEHEAEGSVGDLFGVTIAAEGRSAAGVYLFVFIGDACGHGRGDGTGADAVDGDAFFSEFDGEGTGEADDAVFGCGVG